LEKQFLLIIKLILLSLIAVAQHQADNWVFNHAGLRFFNDSVEVLEYDLSSYPRSTGSMSDESGNLMFFSDGINIYDKNKGVMYHGYNLCMDENLYVHRAIVIPKPESDSLFYVFSLSSDIGNPNSGLYYSTVDISQREGMGEVIQKGTKILDSVANKVTAVYHKNNRDIWLITKKKRSNVYYSHLVTNMGIADTAVISTVGYIPRFESFGMLSASPDGSKIVCSYDDWFDGKGFDLFEFNNETGELLNPIIFTTEKGGVGSSEFSPDGNKLYVVEHYSIPGECIYQYDVSDYNKDKIENSRIKVIMPIDNGFGEIQLAPNGKIYVSKYSGQYYGFHYCGVINYPNREGIDCEAVEMGLYLGENYIDHHTPNFIQNYFFRTDILASRFCFGDSTIFEVSNTYRLDSVRWDFGDQTFSNLTNVKHRFAYPGINQVILYCYYPEKTDTIIRDIWISELPFFSLGSDKRICEDEEIYLYPDEDPPGVTYQWSTGATTSEIKVDSSGNYWLEMQNDQGCAYRDTINVSVFPIPELDLGADTIIQQTDTIVLDAGGPESSFTYQWDDNSTERYRTVFGLNHDPGSYTFTARITTLSGCFNSDSIRITINEVELPESKGCMCLLYPIPAYDEIVVKNLDSKEKTLKIYDSLGKYISSHIISEKSITIDISNLNRAVYYLRIYNSEYLECTFKVLVK
jgi:hypothetical protein